MFSFQLATPKAQADLAEAIMPFLNTAPVTPPVSGPSPAAPQPSSEGAALLAQPRAPMAQTLLAQHMQPMPSAPGLGNPAPAFSVQPQQQPQRFAVGGLASSLPSDPEDHANAQQFVDVRNQQLADMVAKPMRMAKGGLAQPEKLTYDSLTPEEKNFVDYHRRNLAVMPLVRDGDTTTVYGGIDDVPNGAMLHPYYVHGQIVGPQEAMNFAKTSGINFPVYPDVKTAEAREQAIHKDIIEPDTQRYASGDTSWLDGYAKGGLAVRGRGR